MPTQGREVSSWIPRSSYRRQDGVGGDRPPRLPAPSSPSPSPFPRSRVGAALLARWRRSPVRFPPAAGSGPQGPAGELSKAETLDGDSGGPEGEARGGAEAGARPLGARRSRERRDGWLLSCRCPGPGGVGSSRGPRNPLPARCAAGSLVAGCRLRAARGALPLCVQSAASRSGRWAGRGRATLSREWRSCHLPPAPLSLAGARWGRRRRVLPDPGSECTVVGGTEGTRMPAFTAE